jgi:hypothetical protein
MNKRIGVVVAMVVGASACAARQTPERAPLTQADSVAAVYACGDDYLVVIEGQGGPVLLDAAHRELVTSGWTSADNRHFVAFTRVGTDRRPIALQYTVPSDEGGAAEVATFDRARGATFKVIARDDAWRIQGEPSGRASCAARGETMLVSR